MKTPRPYQTQAVDIIVRRNLLLSDECGLGKTLEAIEAIKRLKPPVLIVVPKSLREQWTNELITQGISRNTIMWINSASPVVDGFNVVLCHYEALVKHIDTLSKTRWSLVVCDEAHRIKNRKAQRTNAVKKLKADRKLAMTGTPFDRNPADCWSILNWLYPQFFTSYWRFFEAHVNYNEQQLRTGQVIKSVAPNQPRNAEMFARLLRQYSLRRTKREVRADLPERIDQYIDLRMNDDQAAIYQQLEESEEPIVNIGDSEVTMSIVLTRILRKIQCTTDPTLLNAASSSVKLEWVQDWLDDNPDESVIVFTRFRDTAEKLAKALDRFTLIVGGKRPTIDSSVTKIVGTIAAMGEGLDLPHIDHAIFVDVEYSSILMQQAIDRIHRINIENVKHVYYLRCSNTVDDLVHDAISAKWSTKQLVEAYLKGIRTP